MEALKTGARMSNWNDDRLDHLDRRVDEGFKRMDQEFKKVDKRLGRIEDRFDRFEDRLERFEDRFDRMQHTLLVAVIGGLFTLLASQVTMLIALFT
jgi:predicted nuclease with TOPRIM domain